MIKDSTNRKVTKADTVYIAKHDTVYIERWRVDSVAFFTTHIDTTIQADTVKSNRYVPIPIPIPLNKDCVPAVVTSGVSATPEPSTWIMMLTGLAMLGAIARKRKKDE